jgi:CelD/BcsL family acetyltransferase involved in cellulose biosynthesis
VRRLVLSGVPPDLLEGVGGATLRARIEQAPFIDLAAITDGPGDFLASRSRNTRYQIRRAMRHFAQRGPLGISRPTSAAEAEAWLDAMIALHTSTWQARGQPGAFATAFLCRFHRVLVQRAHAQGELDLLRISAGGEVIGYLYNFRHRGAVYAYQSGFRQEPGTPQARPGLTSHALAIEEARAAGLSRYDFLAGAARYKLSLANAAARLSWNERVPEASLIGLLARGQGILEGLRERWRGD